MNGARGGLQLAVNEPPHFSPLPFSLLHTPSRTHTRFRWSDKVGEPGFS